jgi:hypothetical protein
MRFIIPLSCIAAFSVGCKARSPSSPAEPLSGTSSEGGAAPFEDSGAIDAALDAIPLGPDAVPESPSDLIVTWVVDERKAIPAYVQDTDRTKYRVPVQLTLRQNNKETSVTLKGNAGVVFLNQCNGVTLFWAGMGIRFEVRRTQKNKGEVTKVEWAEMAYERRTPMLKFEFPNGIKVVHHLTWVQVDGKTTTEQCEHP